ncbi:hypothetical protein SAMN05661080_02739 [Modestobacter sp. DSM 44400]|uniref:hypothetical protein n=1 Tax=Modestobacter sp. DSM 44400 TaxID=1550230 RepID=UPI00089A5476|nr:hypothetical protein [Modestobacter sp. DSM 44400]SDY21665.1 hypothetical protein SAMN05661080_02739 [Modestobacter sp. DSM 44400]
MEFPFRPQVAAWLSEPVEQARKVHASIMLTLKPNDGLGAVSDAAPNGPLSPGYTGKS